MTAAPAYVFRADRGLFEAAPPPPDITAEKRARALRFWRHGFAVREFHARVGLTERQVYYVVDAARREGHPDAVNRKRGPRAGAKYRKRAP